MTISTIEDRIGWQPGDISWAEPAEKARRIVDTNGQELLVTDADDSGEYPAAGGGARQVPDDPHLGELAPGGSVGSSPGNEPPRWQPSQNLTAWSDDQDGAGRAGASPWAGGTSGDIKDGSDWTHSSKPEGGHDDRQGATGVPPHFTSSLQGSGDDTWPQGGHGTRQPEESMPGGENAVPPSSSAIVKVGAEGYIHGLGNWHETNKDDNQRDNLVHKNAVEGKVYQQLLENYPPKAISWVHNAEWAGPMNVPFSRIDDDAVKSWAASHEPARLQHFKDKIEAGDPVHPAVSVQEPGEANVKVIDGHHRALAYKALGLPVRTYLGKVGSNGGPWDETHSSQFHQGNDPANKHYNPAEPRGPHGEWAHEDAGFIPHEHPRTATGKERRLFHATDAALSPGDVLKPADQQLGHESKWSPFATYNPSKVYVFDARNGDTAQQDYGNHVYEVEAGGEAEPDPEQFDEEYAEEGMGQDSWVVPSARVLRELSPAEISQLKAGKLSRKTKAEDPDVSKAATLSKADVDYRETGSLTRRCGTCVMFREGQAGDYCTLVKGDIDAYFTCDRWAGAEKKAVFSDLTEKAVTPSLIKVGPEGYIHGYICVRPPCGQYNEVVHDKKTGRVLDPDGSVIGRQLPKKEGDSGYSIRHQETKTVLTGFKTRQDAADALTVYHNIHVLHQLASEDSRMETVSAALKLKAAKKAIEEGKYTDASKRLAEASDAARLSGFMDLQTHADDTRFALQHLPSPVIIAGKPEVLETPKAPEPPVMSQPWLATGYVDPLRVQTRTEFSNGDFVYHVLARDGTEIGSFTNESVVSGKTGNRRLVHTATHANGSRAYRGSADPVSKLVDYHNKLIMESQPAAPAEPPAPAKLDFIPEWAETEAVRSLSVKPSATIDGGVKIGIVREAHHAINHQGRFIPNLVAKTRVEVTDEVSKYKGGKPSTTVGLHYYAQRLIQLAPKIMKSYAGSRAKESQEWNNERGWWSGADSEFSKADQVMAHEFGHGVHYAVSKSTAMEDQRKLWDQLAKALGVPPVTRGLSQDDLDEWVKKNKKDIKEKVSEYGTTDSSEFQAELWSEYTMKEKPRPAAKAYGDFVMRHLPQRTTPYSVTGISTEEFEG